MQPLALPDKGKASATVRRRSWSLSIFVVSLDPFAVHYRQHAAHVILAAVKARDDIHAQIRKSRGAFKLTPGEKSATQQLIADRAEDLRSEQAQWERFEKKLTRQSGDRQ